MPVKKSIETTRPFETSDVIELVGIRPAYLNKFIERRLYGIEPSFKRGEGRGTRRWFSLADLIGIALAWWLFEAGLRTEVIKRVLRELTHSKKENASLAAQILNDLNPPEFLLIEREPRDPKNKAANAPQKAAFVEQTKVTDAVDRLDTDVDVIAIPVRRLFLSLAERLNAFETK